MRKAAAITFLFLIFSPLLVLAEVPLELEKAIQEKTKSLQAVTQKLQETQKSLTDAEEKSKSLKKELNQISYKMNQLDLGIKSSELTIDKLELEIRALQYEIEDSRAFIKSMEDRLKAFDQAVITRKSIGELQITNCPKCLSPLIRHVPEGTCILCKQPVSIDLEKSMLLKMKEELFFQVKESKNILVSKEDRLAQIMREIPILTEQTHLTKSNLDEALTKVKTARDTHLDDLLVKKGSLENQLIFLHKQAKSLSFLEKLKNQKNYLLKQKCSEMKNIGILGREMI